MTGQSLLKDIERWFKRWRLYTILKRSNTDRVLFALTPGYPSFLWDTEFKSKRMVGLAAASAVDVATITLTLLKAEMPAILASIHGTVGTGLEETVELTDGVRCVLNIRP